MKVKLTAAALSDLCAIADWLTPLNPQAADRIGRAIQASVNRLADFPNLGHERPIADMRIRKLGVSRYAYSIYYHVVGDQVEVLHIRDDRRAPLAPEDLVARLD
jgi:plasmid stabilization system protein ParE